MAQVRFHTEDGFRRDADGWFYFVDRQKDAIRRRGENISSFEVEAYLNANPNVAESAAVAASSQLGEDDVRVFIVPVEGVSFDPSALYEDLTWATSGRF